MGDDGKGTGRGPTTTDRAKPREKELEEYILEGSKTLSARGPSGAGGSTTARSTGTATSLNLPPKPNDSAKLQQVFSGE